MSSGSTFSGIKVRDVAYVRFTAPDLDAMEAFLSDFGMHQAQRTDDVLYMRGTDDEGFLHVTHRAATPSFIGFAFTATSVDDLHILAAIEGFSAVGVLEGPGGGSYVSALDPNGVQVEVVAGRDSVGVLPAPQHYPQNTATAWDRQGVPLRITSGPSHVKRLGHCVLNVNDFRATEAWYKSRFGLVTSDEIAIDETMALGAFLRCDQGERMVDHHTLFLLGTGTYGFNHAAFEVHDFDDLMIGNTHLHAAGHHHQWGIGRHILGSQIYDYWLDPYGNIIEHWTDGDLFNSQRPPAVADINTLLGSQWGPTYGSPPM